MTTTQTPSPSEVASSPALFAKHFLKIMDKDDRTVSLIHTPIQRTYLANRSPRDLILKARQVMITTAVQGELFRYATTRPARTLTLADNDDNTQKIRRMAERFYNHLPDNFRPERALANASITTYPGYGSEAMIATAGNKNAGRAGSYRFIHMSEAAFYPDAQSIVASALQGGKPIWVAAESTPNGAQGWFYEACMEALDGNSAWKLHFFAWYDNPEYRIALADGEIIKYTDDEAALVREHRLTPEQIKWRRVKQQELKHLFIQEYPENPHTCFLTSGGGYFGDVSKAFIAPKDAVPIDDHRYVMGVDFGQTNDYTTGVVLDEITNQQVDALRVNKLAWQDMRTQIAAMAAKWNARVLAEANAMGKTNIELLRAGEGGLYKPVNLIPFQTTAQSKPPLIQGLHHALHEGGLQLLDDSFMRHELRSFISKQTPTGAWAYEAGAGAHDDLVIALALAWYGISAPSGFRFLFTEQDYMDDQ